MRREKLMSDMRGLLPAPLRWCLLAAFLVLPGVALQARDLAAYRVGDVADADITTPVPLAVTDAAATAALRAARSLQYPAIFRSVPGATNEMARDFLAAFAQARTNFMADLVIEFHSVPLTEAIIASPEFSRIVTVYDVENKNFPIPDELAAEWARGGDGQALRENLLATLLWAGSRPVRPDAMPAGMILGDTVRLVPVAELDEKLALDTVQQGALLPVASLMTVSNAQAMFRREFPAQQQMFARALAPFLRPNCFPDALFTQLTRGTAVYKLTVSDQFDAGDVLVRRGETIDAKTLAALQALKEKLAEDKPREGTTAAPARAPLAATATVAVASNITVTPKPLAAPATPKPAPVGAVAVQSAVVKPASASTGLPHAGLILTLIGISSLSLLVGGWQILREYRRASATKPAAEGALPLPGVVKEDLTPQDNLTPQVAQAVREAVQQELAMQRRELLIAQQSAANEIAALVRRLDEVQMPMQERLQTYETRIQSLEKELTLRNEENRELLRLKIDMISRQMETERTAALIPPISA